jgi:signal transduction histidine kinase
MNNFESPKHILIVDDKPVNLKVLAQTLSNANYDIALANNGSTAIQMSLDDPPELILLDILMPEMDGFETCEKIKSHPRTKDIPIIFMSALSETINKVKGLSLGAVDYITKPFETDEVLARVKTQLQMRRLNQALEQKNQELSETLWKLEKSQQQLMAQEKLALIGSLTAKIIHELRQPLNFMQDYGESSLELIDKLQQEIKKQRTSIDANSFHYIQKQIKELRENSITITFHSQKAENIIQDMLIQSRTHNHHQRELSDLHSLIDQALNLVAQGEHSLLDIVIEKNYDPEIREIKVIKEQIRHVLINLLDNAFDALKEKQNKLIAQKQSFSPQLLITTKKLPDAIAITIRDNGIGMTTEVKKQIFHPFFSTKPTKQGTGLGLSLSRDIVENNHQGTITIQSELNHFTEVTIKFQEQNLNFL